MKPLLLSVLLAAAGLAAPGDVYYVAPGGSDAGGDGSAGNPWATIAGAAAKVPDGGGTVIVRDGTYPAALIQRKFSNLIVFRAEHPYKAKLQGMGAVALYLYQAANVEISGFEITRGDPGSTFPLAAHVELVNNVILRNNILHDSYNNDVLKINNSCRNVLVIGNILYNAYGGAGQLIDANGCVDVFIRENLFFADYAGSGQPDTLDAGGFMVIKNSGQLPESRRTRITGNVFLNFEGSPGKNFVLFGEDGYPFYETQDATVENNLLIGNYSDPLRAPFGVKGAKDIVFRNNTVTGNLPSLNYAARLNDEGQNLPNQNIRFYNNIWSNAWGTMSPLFEMDSSQNVNISISNNVYWNGGSPIPAQPALVNYNDDASAMIADPMLGAVGDVILPRWTGDSFLSGSATIRQEFERLTQTYGVPDPSSSIVGMADPNNAPTSEILGRVRTAVPDPGAFAVNATGWQMRVVPVPDTMAGGLTSALNQVLLAQPAAGTCGSTIALSSSNPAVAAVPDSVFVVTGSSAAVFPISTTPVNSATTVVITASYATDCNAKPTTASAVVTVTSERLTLNLTAVTTASGTTFQRNQVLIEGVAPAGGLTVTLSSDQPAVAVAAQVNIAEGRSYSDFFPITTGFVSSPTTVHITASLGDSTTVSGSFTVQPPAYGLKLVSNSTFEGQSVPGNQVVLDSLAPAGGAVVQLSSLRPDILQVPATVTVPEGSNIGAFTITTQAVTARTTATILVTFNGRVASVNCDVSPVGLSAISPANFTVAGTGSVKISVRLVTAVAWDTTVQLSQNPPGFLMLPDTVVIPAQTASATFTAQGPAGVTTSQTVSITAKLKGSALTANGTVNRTDVSAVWVGVDGDKARPGNTALVVYLDSPAPPGGLLVQMGTSNAAVFPVPDTVTVPEGAPRLQTAVTVGPVTAETSVIITATGAKTVSRTVRVQP